MTPHPQRKDAGASSFVVCFEGKIQPAHKTGSSAPHRPAGLSLSHTPRPQVATAPGRHRPQAGGAPPGTARPQAPAPTLGVGRPLRAAQGDRQDQSHGPRDLTRREAGHAWPGRTLEPGDPAQLAFRAGAHSTGSGPRPWGSHEPRVLASRTSASSRGAGLHPPWPRPVRSSGLRWGGGCQRAGPPSPGPRASRGGR